jgi:hypothetical protein
MTSGLTLELEEIDDRSNRCVEALDKMSASEIRGA